MPTTDHLASRNAPLVAELRWLVRLRWLVIAIAIGMGAFSGASGDWSRSTAFALELGLVMFLYNIAFWMALRRPETLPGHRILLAVAWLQIGLDLGCLTWAAMRTGGLSSPLISFYVLHMVLCSLLLPGAKPYVASLLAIAMVATALWLTNQWPDDQRHQLTLTGWAVVLLLTVYLTGHITAEVGRHDRALRDEHAKLAAVLQTAADGIITIDDRGIIQSTNPAADRLFGYTAGELLGRNVSVLMPEPFTTEHDQYLENYFRTGTEKIIGIGREVPGRRKDDSEFPLDLAVSRVSLDGRTLFTGITRDITDRKRSEQELRELNVNLQRHQRAMIQQEKLGAMGQMAAGIVHEISNPLASMDTMLQLMQRHPDRFTEQTPKVLRDQVARISRIVRQLTDFAHPNETGWEVRPLNDVVAGALDMVRFDHRIRRVQVTRELDPSVGEARVMFHAMQQVLVNMILNALDAMVDVAAPQLVVRTRRAGEWLVIDISDNGHGIAPENLQRVFEPFFTTKPIGQGTGLGLSISQGLVQRHGGQCQVSSPPGAGTTFRILLPAPAD